MRDNNKAGVWRRLAGWIAAFALAVITMAATGTAPAVAANGDTQSITAKALTDHECSDSEWHFVINQVDTEADAPASISVAWANKATAVVKLWKFTGGVAHYVTTANLDSTVTSATAVIYAGWSGQFNLSHGPCGTPPPTDVLNQKGSASADCTGAVTFHLNNTGSTVEGVYSLIAGGKYRQVTVAAGAKKQVVLYAHNGANYALWGPVALTRLAHGTIPRACAVLHPKGHVNSRCSGKVRFTLNNRHSNRVVAYLLQIGGRSWNVPARAGHVSVVTHHGQPHQRVKLSAMGHVLDKSRIPGTCNIPTPPTIPPHTGEKQVVSGKA